MDGFVHMINNRPDKRCVFYNENTWAEVIPEGTAAVAFLIHTVLLPRSQSESQLKTTSFAIITICSILLLTILPHNRQLSGRVPNL